MPTNIGIVDTMIAFPAEDFKVYDFIRAQLKDPSAKFDFPVEYMFKNVERAEGVVRSIKRSDFGHPARDGPVRH